MNNSRVQNPFCKVWYKGCGEDSIIFDKYGDISKLLKTNIDEQCIQIDILHQINKYWLFCYLSIKYYKRKDIFKLLSVMQDLFHTHIGLLLSIYNKESWGGWPSLVKNNIPSEKQENLLRYFCSSVISIIKDNLLYVINMFSNDIVEICHKKDIKYDGLLEQQIKEYIKLIYLGKAYYL